MALGKVLTLANDINNANYTFKHINIIPLIVHSGALCFAIWSLGFMLRLFKYTAFNTWTALSYWQFYYQSTVSGSSKVIVYLKCVLVLFWIRQVSQCCNIKIRTHRMRNLSRISGVAILTDCICHPGKRYGEYFLVGIQHKSHYFALFCAVVHDDFTNSVTSKKLFLPQSPSGVTCRRIKGKRQPSFHSFRGP